MPMEVALDDIFDLIRPYAHAAYTEGFYDGVRRADPNSPDRLEGLSFPEEVVLLSTTSSNTAEMMARSHDKHMQEMYASGYKDGARTIRSCVA